MSNKIKLNQIQIDAETLIQNLYSETDYTTYLDREKYINEYNIKPKVDGGTETPNPFYKLGILFGIGSAVKNATKNVASEKNNLEIKSRKHENFLNRDGIVRDSQDDKLSAEYYQKAIAMDRYNKALVRRQFFTHAWFFSWGTHWDAVEYQQRVDLYNASKSNNNVLDEGKFENVTYKSDLKLTKIEVEVDLNNHKSIDKQLDGA